MKILYVCFVLLFSGFTLSSSTWRLSLTAVASRLCSNNVITKSFWWLLGKSLWTDPWTAMKACLKYFRWLEGSAFIWIFKLKGMVLRSHLFPGLTVHYAVLYTVLNIVHCPPGPDSVDEHCTVHCTLYCTLYTVLNTVHCPPGPDRVDDRHRDDSILKVHQAQGRGRDIPGDTVLFSV